MRIAAPSTAERVRTADLVFGVGEAGGGFVAAVRVDNADEGELVDKAGIDVFAGWPIVPR